MQQKSKKNKIKNKKKEVFIFKYTKCDKACLTCFKGYENNNTNCEQCNYENGYYPIYGENISNCFNNETIKPGYYLDINQKIWDKCYYKCEECFSKGNNINMNCLSCKSDLINESNNQKIFYKITNDNNCIEICLNNTFMTKNGNCVLTCPDNTYNFYSNNSCIDFCPNGYEINKINNE